jgi:hypothetical protein
MANLQQEHQPFNLSILDKPISLMQLKNKRVHQGATFRQIFIREVIFLHGVDF